MYWRLWIRVRFFFGSTVNLKRKALMISVFIVSMLKFTFVSTSSCSNSYTRVCYRIRCFKIKSYNQAKDIEEDQSQTESRKCCWQPAEKMDRRKTFAFGCQASKKKRQVKKKTSFLNSNITLSGQFRT